MEKIENIILKARKNNNKIAFDEIYQFSYLSEEEFQGLLELLERYNIQLIIEDFDFASETYCEDSITDQYLREISRISLLTIEEEKRLLLLYKNGDKKAYDKLIESNLRLVAYVAKKYSSFYKGSCIDLLDLIQDGTFGLMRAIEKFDLNKGLKLSTYATWWIRQMITRSIADKSHTIRVPVYITEKSLKILKFKSEYGSKYSKEPSIQECAEACNMSVKEVENVLLAIKDPISFDLPISNNEDEDAVIQDLISDQDMNFSDEIIEKMFSEDFWKLVGKVLNERELYIIESRFGKNGEIKSLGEIGQECGITRERVRQLEFRAKKKLKIHLKNYN